MCWIRGMTNSEHREKLEAKLTTALRRKHPGPLTRVVIPDDGKFALLYDDGKHTAQQYSSSNGNSHFTS
jgi:hypothetical protein